LKIKKILIITEFGRLFCIIGIRIIYNYKINNEKIITQRFTFSVISPIIRRKAETKGKN